MDIQHGFLARIIDKKCGNFETMYIHMHSLFYFIIDNRSKLPHDFIQMLRKL